MKSRLVIIGQNEWGSVKRTDSIMTYGINQCCALMVVSNEKTALAHLDIYTDLSFVKDILSEFKQKSYEVFLLYRNGPLYFKIASKLKELGQAYQIKALGDQPNLLFTKNVVSTPDRNLVTTALNNPNGISDFLGFKAGEIEINGRNFLERAQYNHHLLLNCMFHSELRPIVRVCTDSVFQQQNIHLSSKVQELLNLDETELRKRLTSTKEYNRQYNLENVIEKIVTCADITKQIRALPSISSTSLNISPPVNRIKPAVIVACLVALAIAMYSSAREDISK